MNGEQVEFPGPSDHELDFSGPDVWTTEGEELRRAGHEEPVPELDGGFDNEYDLMRQQDRHDS